MMKSCWHLQVMSTILLSRLTLSSQPSCRPDWSELVSTLHSLHSSQHYLTLSLPTIPTPPSSPDSPRYNNVKRVQARDRTGPDTREGIDGIAPLAVRRASTERKTRIRCPPNLNILFPSNANSELPT